MTLDEIKTSINLKLDPRDSLKCTYATFSRTYVLYLHGADDTICNLIPICKISSAPTLRRAWRLAYLYYYGEMP